MEAARAVERLTEPHSELVDGQYADCDPLLEMLREARYPNLGRTKGGGGTGDVLDVQALTIYENIDGIVRSWLAHYRQHHTGELIELTVRLHKVLQAEHAGGRLEDPERMFAMFGQWVSQIEDYFDPPKEYELTAPCAECDAERVENADGLLKWAVRVSVKIGRAVIPECHACGYMWVGRDALTDLAEKMGVEVDWVALRELTGETVAPVVESVAKVK